MKLVAVGAEAVGVLAIGQVATGIVAVGQLATGVVAIGQLARGGLVIGQLGLGLVSFGQLSVGVLWSGGMVGVGATAGPGLVLGLFGRLSLLRLLRRREGTALSPVRGRTRLVVATVLVPALAALWWFAAGQWLVHDLTRTGGVLVEAPPPLPCVPLC
jgi:hypothetical protein